MGSTIDELAKWAVDKYNLDSNSNLEFVKVGLWKRTVISDEGTWDYITLEAKDGSHNKLYAATIFVLNEAQDLKELKEFKLIFGQFGPFVGYGDAVALAAN